MVKYMWACVLGVCVSFLKGYVCVCVCVCALVKWM